MQSWDDEQLALLRPQYPDWDLWAVRLSTQRQTVWCAKRNYEAVASINADSPEHLIDAIRAQDAAQQGY